MKLTIVHPCMGRIPGKNYIRSWQMEPLPPAYLASLTPDHIDIAFWDDRLEEIPYDAPTDLVAISVETYTAKRSYQIATEYRRRGVPVVMGGFHPTLVTDEVVEYAEAVVVGEAEQTFPLLLADFQAGRMRRVYRSKNRPNLRFIRPDRRIFAGKRYLKLGLIETARGCVFRCNFCAVTSYFDATQSRRPIDALLDEVAEVSRTKKLIFFVDDNIVSNIKFAKEFYRALIPLQIRWVGQATITMTYDDELMGLMRDSGCQGVLIGFESLNPGNLKAMNKRFNAARGGFVPALKQLKKFGIRLYATFIFGYDHDTPESFDHTIEFCKKHKIYMTAFNHLTPFPGTPLYEKLEQEGRMLYDRWWLDNRYRYGQVPFRTRLPPDLISSECVRARKSFYDVRSIFSRMVDRTNSGNLFMFRNYWFINLLLRKEAAQRENYPLGDLRFKGELMKVRSGNDAVVEV